jgi:anti-anti-sigma factor
MRYDTTFGSPVFGCNQWELGDGLTRLLLSGDLDVASVERFQERTRRLLASGCEMMEVDLSRVEFMDSAGLASLVGLYRDCQEAGCDILFCDDTGRQEQLLTLSGLDRRLPFARPQLPPAALEASEYR